MTEVRYGLQKVIHNLYNEQRVSIRDYKEYLQIHKKKTKNPRDKGKIFK